jgi:hypothetical protein
MFSRPDIGALEYGMAGFQSGASIADTVLPAPVPKPNPAPKPRASGPAAAPIDREQYEQSKAHSARHG